MKLHRWKSALAEGEGRGETGEGENLECGDLLAQRHSRRGVGRLGRLSLIVAGDGQASTELPDALSNAASLAHGDGARETRPYPPSPRACVCVCVCVCVCAVRDACVVDESDTRNYPTTLHWIRA